MLSRPQLTKGPLTLPLYLWQTYLSTPTSLIHQECFQFPCGDFIKESSICALFHSTSMSTLKYCLQVLFCCICMWLPAPTSQQHEGEAPVRSPLFSTDHEDCKMEGLAKDSLRSFTAAGRRGFFHRLFYVQTEKESREPSGCKAGWGCKVTVGAVERHLVWRS